MSWRHVVATALLVLGVGLEVLAVVGLMAMRDLLDRLHYVGLAGFGALAVALAILVRESFSLIADKALLTGLLIVALGPLVVHATARAARIRQLGDWRDGIERVVDKAP